MYTAWTIGDIHGIGPEILLKSSREAITGRSRPLVFGSEKALRFYSHTLGIGIDIAVFDTMEDFENVSELPDGILPVISTGEPDGPIRPGVISAEAGRIAMRSIETAARLCLDGKLVGMVTAPIHKEAIALAGYSAIGHTDYLAGLCRVPEPIMLFYDPSSMLTVALASIHIPYAAVPEKIRSMDFGGFLDRLSRSLQTDFNINAPRIAVLGLNPHASDGGVMGTEEKTIITPGIQDYTEQGVVEGPFPADGFFGSRRYRDYDAVVAMYHDQGLLPFKVLAFESGVNVTTGLPVVRTSPDHGTGFDIAGQDKASITSFIEAARLAERIAKNREKRRQKAKGKRQKSDE